MLRNVMKVVSLVFVFSLSTPAWAIPAFARNTGMSCSSCHDAWPRLNDFGELYRDRGYRVAPSQQSVWTELLGSVPASFRTTVGYQYTSNTHQATDSGDKTVSTGSFPFPAGDIYFGGALADHVSVYADIAGFSQDATASLESAWGRINDVVPNWVNIKVGHLEMDLPVSMHRSLTIYSPFLVYGYHPSGSTNGFNFGENQLGVEVMGHSPGPGFRYSVTFSTSSEVATANLFSAPVVYGHATYTWLPASKAIGRVRVGAFGDVGWWPTRFQTLTSADGVAVPVPGTWSGLKQHSRAGADFQMTFGSVSTPLTFSAVWMNAQEDAALVEKGARSARFTGGFTQLDYTPVLPFTFGVRYDGVYNLQQADLAQPKNSNQQQGLTAFARYSVWMGAWGALAVHVEGGNTVTQNAASVPINAVRSTFAFAGLDFLL